MTSLQSLQSDTIEGKRNCLYALRRALEFQKTDYWIYFFSWLQYCYLVLLLTLIVCCLYFFKFFPFLFFKWLRLIGFIAICTYTLRGHTILLIHIWIHIYTYYNILGERDGLLGIAHRCKRFQTTSHGILLRRSSLALASSTTILTPRVWPSSWVRGLPRVHNIWKLFSKISLICRLIPMCVSSSGSVIVEST